MRGSWLTRMSVLLCSLPLVSACGDDDGGPPPDPPALVTVLPAETRGVLAVDFGSLLSGDAAGAIATLLEGRGSDAALNAPFAAIARYLQGADIAATMDRVLLAQSIDAPGRSLLVAKLLVRGLFDVFDRSDLAELPRYRGQRIYAKTESDLQVCQLRDGRLLVGVESVLRAAIDTLDGENPGVADAAIGPFLAVLDGGDPFAFVYGLPALYAEVEFQGPGASTLRGASVVTGTLDFTADSVGGEARVHTDNAANYVERFNGLVAATDTAALAIDESGAVVVTIPPSAIEKTPSELIESRSLLKKLVHAMDAVDYTDAVVHGGNTPWMNFDVGGEPNSIFVNFEFKGPDQIEAFEANELPEGFSLAPLRILDTDEPTYFLVLNAYNSSGGLVQGARAEWSVFVEDPEDGHPRFLVVQAAAENISADSVNLLTQPEPVSHARDDGDIVTYVGVEDPDGGEEQHYFSSRIVWPQVPEERVDLDREFVAANDYIFWGNGVADRVLYNASMHNREAVRIPDDEIEVIDDSRWASYVHPVPKHTYVYLNPLEIVISPWWNLDAGYLDVTAEHLATLIDFKNNFYPGAVRGIAEASVAGEGDALTPFVVGAAAPSAYFNFVITEPLGFADAADLPEGIRLAKLRLLESDGDPESYLSLRVYAVDAAAKGLRAEWVVYVERSNGRPQTLVVDVLTDEIAPDAEVFLRLPSLVEQERNGPELRTSLRSESIEFLASLDLTNSVSALPSRDWVEAGDWVCGRNGVCDKIFYDGATMEEPVALVDADGVDVLRFSTPWNSVISSEPVSVFVREGVQRYAWNPWQNVGAPE